MSKIVRSEECLKGAINVSIKPNVAVIGFNAERDVDVVEYITKRLKRGVSKVRVRTMVFDQFDMSKRFYDAILKEVERKM